jgi:ubiquinone/menaquinone biosynthesis C-methylase UbiE
MHDPLAGSTWSAPSTVDGFARSQPNDTLLGFAARERARVPRGRAIDIGCGAGRNAVPLARQGWQVIGTDFSWPMLTAAKARAVAENEHTRLGLALAPMDALPARDRAFDLLVAHGIWNLARSTSEFRRAIQEAGRVAAPGAALFVFTFSRSMLPPDTPSVPGEPFVFTQFSGQPQCMVTPDQLTTELSRAGFAPDDAVPCTEHNLPPVGTVHALRPPVILEAAFRFTGR